MSLLLERALSFVSDELQAKRALVLYDGYGRTLGLENSEKLWTTGEISFEMLKNFLASKSPQVVHDPRNDPEYGERVSVLLTGLGSIMFVPLVNELGRMRGFIYVDLDGGNQFVIQESLERLTGFVKYSLEPMLHNLHGHLTWNEVQATHWLTEP